MGSIADSPSFHFYWQTEHGIQRHTRHSLPYPGSQSGPSRGLSLMSSQGSVDSDHLGKLRVGVEDPLLAATGLGCIGKELGRGIRGDLLKGECQA